MMIFSHSSRETVKTRLARTAAVTSLCTVALLGLPSAPALAGSPVSPPEHHVFVIGPADGGACPFPVQWDITSRSLGLELPHSFLSPSPDWHLTLTNLDTGKTWTPHGDGTIAFRDQPDGSVLQTLHGVNYTPLLDEQLIGTWSRSIDPETGAHSGWAGSGTIVDVCDMLS